MGSCFSRLLNRTPPPPSPPPGTSPIVRYEVPTQETQPQIRVKALYDYAAQTPGDLSFAAGEILLLEREEIDGWWWCRISTTGASGFVPSNFVQRLDLGPESLPCWFDVDRQEAMRSLLMPGYKPGIYLLRPCHQQKELAKYTLSVRSETVDKATGEKRPNVSHYMVRSLDNGGFFISPNNKFSELTELLKFYSQPSSGLTVHLDKPCPKVWVPPAQFRDFEVDRNRIVLQEKLGAGSFGEVFKAELGKGQLVAVKTMMEGAMRKEQFMGEGRIMHKLHHPKIVQLLGVCTKGEPMYIITEFMPNGDLKKYLLKDREVGKITVDIMVSMLSQIAEGMEYLEQKGFVHRDLRAANILVGHSNIVKVGDFGLSKYLDGDIYGDVEVVDNKFPIRWTAPEAANCSDLFSTKSDVWSFGIVVFEVVTKGSNPYSNLANRDVLDKVSKENYRIPNPMALGSEYDNNLHEVMLDCWKTDPADRPTFSRLKNIFQSFATEFEKQYVQNG